MANPVTIQVQPTVGTDPAAGKPDVTNTDPANGTIRIDPTKVEAAKEKAARPTWLPEKFATPEALAQAYSELEKKQGAAPAKTETPVTQTPEQIAAAATAANIDLGALSDEYIANGELSEATITALEAKGLKRSDISSYVEGQKALAGQLLTAIHSEVGGAEGLTNMLSWAKANMTAAEVTAYNKAMESGVESAKLAVRGVFAKYSAAIGQEPTLVTGRGVNTSLKPFADSQEVVMAMADKRYQTSSSYRKEVADRLAASSLFA